MAAIEVNIIVCNGPTVLWLLYRTYTVTVPTADLRHGLSAEGRREGEVSPVSLAQELCS